MTKQMIKSVVDQFDPIGLLEMNCPAEEYDAEVERIFARIRKGMSVRDTRTVGTYGGIVCGIQLVLLILSIFPTEIALKRKYG